MGSLAERISRIRQRIEQAASRSGRDASGITVVAAAKYVEPARIAEAIACGISHVAENRVQEASRVIPAIEASGKSRPTWHMIGRLQTNKVSKAAVLFDRFDSVDRPEVLEALERSLAKIGKTAEALVQVRLSGEPDKSGISLEGLPGLVQGFSDAPHLKLMGLMAMAPFTEDRDAVRRAFAKLREMLGALNAGRQDADKLTVLSMGMSGDFEIAIEEGATELRLGQILFGARDRQ